MSGNITISNMTIKRSTVCETYRLRIAERSQPALIDGGGTDADNVIERQKSGVGVHCIC